MRFLVFACVVLSAQALALNHFTQPEDERNGNGLMRDKLMDQESRGVYYVYHPTGLLQKVSYSTENDDSKMDFAAKLKYENVEPIVGPVYTYHPKTYVFKRLQ
ncbi:uncharacterized protein LOC126747979 [Anthonomus grandis grandis]|uniref:uncharacterized protein LOC126747979 n=1 Tax=Anthonomus grandis grandis TaxID=2921223 RepID=UPI0021656FAA|nr:uncharacterized protein LOC126747979 [Anthonomus grandis grandis]